MSEKLFWGAIIFLIVVIAGFSAYAISAEQQTERVAFAKGCSYVNGSWVCPGYTGPVGPSVK